MTQVKLITIVLLLIALVFFNGPTQAQQRGKKLAQRVPNNVTEYRNLEYALVGKKSLLLDLYIPKNVSHPPLLVWIHGGGWRSGDKDKGGKFVPLATNEGYACASINYRLSGEAKFPAQIQDCKAAIRWLRANAEKYGYDATHIGVGGSSAGGHLAALLGTSGGDKNLEGAVGGNLDQSSKVQAVCDMWGPTDFLQMDAHAIARTRNKHDSARSPESLLIGGPIQENKEKVAKANPITYVDKNDPPFLIIHGSHDALVPVHQSQILSQALKKAGVPVQLHIVENAGHGGREFNTPETDTMILKFFDKYLKKAGKKETVKKSVSKK